jgi:hypothetical protein
MRNDMLPEFLLGTNQKVTWTRYEVETGLSLIHVMQNKKRVLGELFTHEIGLTGRAMNQWCPDHCVSFSGAARELHANKPKCS